MLEVIVISLKSRALIYPMSLLLQLHPPCPLDKARYECLQWYATSNANESLPGLLLLIKHLFINCGYVHMNLSFE